MRYQNPLYSLVTQAPLSPRACQAGQCAAVCSETAANCSQCQKLAEDVRRLMQEKQELLVDLINTNQAFMRLQHDHTALLQRVAGIKVHQQPDASQAHDTSTVMEQQHRQQQQQLQQQQQCTADSGLDLSAQVSRLLDPNAAAALPPGPAPISTAAVEGTRTPSIEPCSPPVKRKKAPWDKSAPLRDSFKSLGGLLSARGGGSSTAATAAQAAPTSPKSITAPRSPKAFSRLRRSLQMFTNSSSNTPGGNVASTAEPLLSSSSSTPIIDVGALTQINGRTQAAGLQTLPCISSNSGSGGAGGLGLGSKAPGRSSLDGNAAGAFSRSISSKASFNLSKLTGRHSVDCSSSSSKDTGLLPSKISLSARTRRSASFLAGSFARTFPHSPKAAAVQLPLPGIPLPNENAGKDVAGQQQQPVMSSLPSSRYHASSTMSNNDSSRSRSCDSHRLNSCVPSEAGSTPASSQPGNDSNSHNNNSSSSCRSLRPSHLRPLSPKSRALKDLASPTTPATAAADSPVPVAAAAAVAAPASTEAGAEPTTGPAPSVPAASELPSAAPAAAAAAASPPVPISSAAAAVAELLLPFSAPASSKVKFLKPCKRSKHTPVSADSIIEPAAAAAVPAATGSPRAYFGRVWDKWHLKARSQDAQDAQATDAISDAAAAAAAPTPAAEAAATAVCVLSTCGAVDAAAAADCGPAAGVSKGAAFLAAWPLDFEAELEYEGGISTRPSIV